MEGVREKILEKLSEALVACGDNTEYQDYVINLKAMMASEGSTKTGILMFLSMALNKMTIDCGACATLISIKALLESEEEVPVPDGIGLSNTATGMENQPDTATGMETQPDTATGMVTQPDTATGMETQPDTATDLKIPKALSEAEVEDLRRPFGLLTEEHGWTSVNYGADLHEQGKVQRIFNVKYGALNAPVISFKDNSTGEYRVFVAFDHIVRETVAEGRVQPFSFTYSARETWWQCELARFGKGDMAKENIKTFQSTTMPGMGIRILSRVAKQEVNAKHSIKRGEVVLCPPSWDMDTVDRLCQLISNTKKGKGHKSYILLVELDTGGKNMQEVQSAPRVKSGGNASMPLWSPVVEHWDPNKKNLEKTSTQLMNDINDRCQSYCLSFADFMRATLLPGYWLALKTSSTSQDLEPEAATTWVDKAPSPQDLINKSKDKVRMENIPLIALYPQVDCLAIHDLKEVVERRDRFDRVLQDGVLKHLNVPTDRGALCDPSWVRGIHGARELCSKTEERCQDCTALYQQLSGVLRRFESTATQDRSTRSRSKLGDEEQKEHAQRLKSVDVKLSSRGQDRVTTRSGGIDSVILFLSWLMRYLYNLDALPFELDIVTLCASAYFHELVNLYIVHSSLNPGRTISGYVCDATLKKKRDCIVWLTNVVSSKMTKLLTPLTDRPNELTAAGVSRPDLLNLITRLHSNNRTTREINYKFNGDTVKQIVGGDPVQIGSSPSLSHLRQAAKYLRSALTVAEQDELDPDIAVQRSMEVCSIELHVRGLAARTSTLRSFHTRSLVPAIQVLTDERFNVSVKGLVQELINKEIIHEDCLVWMAVDPRETYNKADGWKKTILGLPPQTSLAVIDHAARIIYHKSESDEEKTKAREYLLERERTLFDVEKAYAFLRKDRRSFNPMELLEKMVCRHRLFFPADGDRSFDNQMQHLVKNISHWQNYTRNIDSLLKSSMTRYYTHANLEISVNGYTITGVRSMVQTFWGEKGASDKTKSALSDLVYLNTITTTKTVYDKHKDLSKSVSGFMDSGFDCDTEEGRSLLVKALNLSRTDSFKRAAKTALASEPRDPDDDPNEDEEAVAMDHSRAHEDENRKARKKKFGQAKKRERLRKEKAAASADEADGMSVASDGADGANKGDGEPSDAAKSVPFDGAAGGGGGGGGAAQKKRGQKRQKKAIRQDSGQQDDADQNYTPSSTSSRRMRTFQPFRHSLFKDDGFDQGRLVKIDCCCTYRVGERKQPSATDPTGGYVWLVWESCSSCKKRKEGIKLEDSTAEIFLDRLMFISDDGKKEEAWAGKRFSTPRTEP